MTTRVVAWETAIALLIGVGAGAFLPNDFYESTTSEIVTLLSIFMAAVIPAMLLGATALRAGSFTVKKINALSFAIDRQISLFGGLFIYASIANIFTIMGKALSWRLPSIETGLELLPVLKLVVSA